MNILHLRSSEFLGSPERLIIGQVEHLPQYRSICGSYVRPRGDNRFLRECERRGIATASISESFTGDWRIVAQVRELVAREEIDLVVSHDYKSNFYAYRALRRTDVRQIAYFHGVTTEDMKVRIYNFIDRLVLRRLNRIVAVSGPTALRLERMGISPDRISVVPNAVADDMLRPENDISSETADHVRIVAAGRLSHEKGYDLLLQAVSRIKDASPPFRVYLYGFGPEENRLKRMADDLQIKNFVEFCGFTDNLAEVFDRMDFLVLSSRSEGMPVVVLEAWARRLGVVATAVGGVPDLIESNKTGVLMQPQSVADLVEKLNWAIENRSQLAQFGRAGYDLVKEKYNFSRQALLLAAIYESTVKP